MRNALLDRFSDPTGATAALTVLLLPLLVACQPAQQAQRGGAFDEREVTVRVENATFSYITGDEDPAPAPEETWFVTGDVTGVDGADAAGHWWCWGTFTHGQPGTAAGFTAFIQRYQIDGQGTVIVSGSEMSTEPLVVLGGTGAFRGASGTVDRPAPTEGEDIDGDGEPEMDGQPLGVDADGDGDNDGTGIIDVTFDLLVPAMGGE